MRLLFLRALNISCLFGCECLCMCTHPCKQYSYDWIYTASAVSYGTTEQMKHYFDTGKSKNIIWKSDKTIIDQTICQYV